MPDLHSKIIARSKALLAARGCKPELSPQAECVIEALCETLAADAVILEAQGQSGVNRVRTKGGRMVKPTIEEILEHAKEIELPEPEARKMFDWYESNGWKVSKNPMRLWTAALANWKRGWMERQTQRNGHATPYNLRQIIDAKERICVDLKNKFSVEVATGRQWSDDSKRQEFRRIKAEIVKINEQLSRL